jgi:hypothetical protein
MQLRTTKTRAALAALFVLAGVGLASLLSPLVGTALATVGQVVNISDHSSSANFATVTPAGELKTNGVVSGKVALALPPQPFSFAVAGLSSSSVYVPVLGPTSATIALTDFDVANDPRNGGRFVTLEEFSAPAPNSSCGGPFQRFVGTYVVASAQTLVDDFETPIVLKPLASGQAWCLSALVGNAISGDPNFSDDVQLGGYVLSGTFTPPSAPPPGKAGVMPRRTR